MNVVKEINRINEREAALGLDDRGSWHDQYRDSAWIYIGGLPYELTEGDVLCVFSQCVWRQLNCMPIENAPRWPLLSGRRNTAALMRGAFVPGTGRWRTLI